MIQQTLTVASVNNVQYMYNLYKNIMYPLFNTFIILILSNKSIEYIKCFFVKEFFPTTVLTHVKVQESKLSNEQSMIIPKDAKSSTSQNKHIFPK